MTLRWRASWAARVARWWSVSTSGRAWSIDSRDSTTGYLPWRRGILRSRGHGVPSRLRDGADVGPCHACRQLPPMDRQGCRCHSNVDPHLLPRTRPVGSRTCDQIQLDGKGELARVIAAASRASFHTSRRLVLPYPSDGSTCAQIHDENPHRGFDGRNAAEL